MQSPQRPESLVLLGAYLRAQADRGERIEREIMHEITVVLRGTSIPEPTLSDMAKRLTDLFFHLRRS